MKLNRLSPCFAGALLAGVLAMGASVTTQAAFLVPDFSGTTSFDDWYDMNKADDPALSSFPGTGSSHTPWPGVIASKTTGAGSDAVFEKLAGVGHPAADTGTGVYVFTTAQFAFPNPYTGRKDGDYAVSDATPVAGLTNLLFQLEIEGVGLDFFSGVLLNYNGGSQGLVADFSDESFVSTGLVFGEQAYRYTLGYQWDVTGLGPITDFSIVWTSPEHSMHYAMQLDQSDTFAQAIPEPAGILALGLGLLGMLARMGLMRRNEPA